MLPQKLTNSAFERETITYDTKGFSIRFLRAHHTNDGWSGFIPHTHEELEFLFVADGKADFFIGGGGGGVPSEQQKGGFFFFNFYKKKI